MEPISMFLWLVAGAAAAGIILAFWDEIRNFFIDSFNRLPQKIQKDLQDFVVLAQAIDRTILSTLEYYSYDRQTQNWSVTTETKSISANDVPEHIRQKLASGNQANITDDLKKELNLTL